jgi:hypothetical protein
MPAGVLIVVVLGLESTMLTVWDNAIASRRAKMHVFIINQYKREHWPIRIYGNVEEESHHPSLTG